MTAGRMAARRRVAVVGSGISGLAAARQLSQHAHVVLFEADARLGGHAHTVDVSLGGVTHGVDTGFLVFNHDTYPQLVQLFQQLGVRTAPSEMSFSVQAPEQNLLWSGTNLDTVFAQRRNLLRPAFLGMLRDLMRFNRETTELAEKQQESALSQPIGDWLLARGFGQAFRDWYLLPMLGCIWSCPTDQMLRFPVATMIRFCHNHGLIRVTNRPQWYTVQGGSREYVRRMAASITELRTNTAVLAVRRSQDGRGGVWLDTAQGTEHFDAVVLAGHTDQSLRLLGTHATLAERATLGAIAYQANRAVLHTDASVLPARQKAWAAWNYVRAPQHAQEQSAVCLHYLINKLQPLPWQQPVVVSLNPLREPAPGTVHGEYTYHHPVFDTAAIAAQARVPALQGQHGVWFAGAWTRYGFHEDGLMSGLAAAEHLLGQWASEADRPDLQAEAA